METTKTLVNLTVSTLDGQHGRLINYHPDHGDILMFVTNIPVNWGPVTDGMLSEADIAQTTARYANGLTVVWADHLSADVNRDMVKAAADAGVTFVQIVPVIVVS